MLEITIAIVISAIQKQLLIQIIVNIFGLIEEIQKLKLNVTGKLYLISIKTYRLKNIEKIIFQPNKIFVRNDLFEKIIKSCKATNLEYLKLKEKLGLCLYEVICDEQELISTSEEIFTQPDVKNKQLKEQNEKLRKKIK